MQRAIRGFVCAPIQYKKKMQSNDTLKFAFKLHSFKNLHQVFSHFRHCLTDKR